MKSVQTPVQPTIQTDHPDLMAEVGGLVSDSPLFTLASVSVELLKDYVLEIVYTPA